MNEEIDSVADTENGRRQRKAPNQVRFTDSVTIVTYSELKLPLSFLNGLELLIFLGFRLTCLYENGKPRAALISRLTDSEFSPNLLCEMDPRCLLIGRYTDSIGREPELPLHGFLLS